MYVVAHVSDTHFGSDVQDPSDRAAAVMDHLLAMDPRPDVLVHTGDVADHGLDHEYAAAHAWLDRWPGPVAVSPGNHDVRTAFVEGLGIEPRSVVAVNGYRFVMLDSLIDAGAGERGDEGRLGDQQLAWLDARLGESDDPAFGCRHHPPTTIGLELMDPIRLMDGDALAAVIDHHPQVVATLVGHAHTMSATSFAGRPLLTGGGIVSTVTADAEDVDTLWYGAPPSFTLHLVDAEQRVTTHWRALPAQ